MKYLPLKLNPQGVKKVISGELWLTLRDCLSAEKVKEIEPGSLVSLYTKEGHFLAQAYLNPRAHFAIKILERKEVPIDEEFFYQKFRKSLKLREKLYKERVFRLIHGEGDYLPGLIIDVYDEILVLQFHTLGMERLKDSIIIALKRLFNPRALILKNDFEKRKEESLFQYVEILGEEVGEVYPFQMDGLKFLLPIKWGQKTGFFLDQRENRRFLEKVSEGITVIDGFSYLGAFSFYALKGGAKRAFLVDRSEAALQLAEEIAKLNGFGDKIIPVQGDVFQLLKNPFAEANLLILDPPAFIKARRDFERGFKKYEELYSLGLNYFSHKEGFLLLFSCSAFLKFPDFKELVKKLLIKRGLEARVIKYLFQATDHPVNPLVEETEYLKGVFLKIN